MDYNIYIHSISTVSNESPTTPFQLRNNGEVNAAGSADAVSGGGGAATAVRMGAAFLMHPDSSISGVMSTAVGKLGVVAAVASVVKDVTFKAFEQMGAYLAVQAGEYELQYGFNNFKQVLHNVFTPFSTYHEIERNRWHLRVENAKSEQKRLLLGGSIINANYGRYL